MGLSANEKDSATGCAPWKTARHIPAVRFRSHKLMKERVSGLTPAQQHKILRGNAERLFQFTPAPNTR